MAGVPKVSILMPCFNQSAYVGEAISSVLDQDFEDYELLVVDDGSDDSSYEAAEQTAFGDERVKLMRQEHQGLAPALNFLFHRVRGEFVVLLDADDILEPDALSQGLADLEQHPKAAASCGFVDCIDAFGLPHDDPERYLADLNVERDPAAVVARQLLGNALSSVGAMMRRKSLPQGDLCHEELKLAPLYGLWLRILAQADICVAPHTRGRFRVHGQNMGLDPASQTLKMVEIFCCLETHAPRILKARPELDGMWPNTAAALGAMAFSYGNIGVASQHLADGYKHGVLDDAQSLMLLQCLLALKLERAAKELASELEDGAPSMSEQHQAMFAATKEALSHIKSQDDDATDPLN